MMEKGHPKNQKKYSNIYLFKYTFLFFYQYNKKIRIKYRDKQHLKNSKSIKTIFPIRFFTRKDGEQKDESIKYLYFSKIKTI